MKQELARAILKACRFSGDVVYFVDNTEDKSSLYFSPIRYLFGLKKSQDLLGYERKVRNKELLVQKLEQSIDNDRLRL